MIPRQLLAAAALKFRCDFHHRARVTMLAERMREGGEKTESGSGGCSAGGSGSGCGGGEEGRRE